MCGLFASCRLSFANYLIHIFPCFQFIDHRSYIVLIIGVGRQRQQARLTDLAAKARLRLPELRGQRRASPNHHIRTAPSGLRAREPLALNL